MVRAPEIAHARAIIKYGIAVQMLDCKFHGSYNLGWTEMDGAGWGLYLVSKPVAFPKLYEALK